MILLCATALVWGGCSDDDEGAVDPSKLVGTWMQTKFYDGELDKWYDDEHDRMIFRKDGTGEMSWSHEAQSGSDTFTWTLRGNTIHVDYEGDTEESRIEKLTDTELVLAGDYYGEDGGRYTDRVFLERIE